MAPDRNVVLVEGTSDFGVIKQVWARHHEAVQPFTLEPRFGLENLREAFSAALLGSEIERLAIVVDADDSVERRWPGFYQILVERGYRPVPKALPPEGIVLHRADRNVPVVGVWLMPNNQTGGRLEDFVSYMVPAGDRLWEHASVVVDSIPAELRRFKDHHKLKAHVHTWLAWQKEPGLRLGPAVERRLLDSAVPEVATFVSWLERMFVNDLERDST